MNQQHLPVSVLIPTMNRPESLNATLKTYMQARWLPKQIVVVDQTQDPVMAADIRRIVEEYSDLADMVYVFQQKPSSATARNNAMDHASEDILIFSDDDISVYDDTIKQLWEIMQDASVAMVAAADDNSPKSRTNIGYLLGTKSFHKRKIGHVTASVLGRYPDDVRGQIETQWAMGYFFSVRKSLAEKWNIRWDDKLTGYAFSEDLDFSYGLYKKAKEAGLRCVLDERLHVRHMVSQEYRIPGKKQTYVYVINRAYLSAKHNMGLVSEAAMLWANSWRLVERIVKRQNPKDFWDAMVFTFRHRKEIRQGILNYPV